MPGVLDGRTAIVTGAGRGIGRAVSLALAAEGARVVAAARSADQIESCADEIRAAGGEALVVQTDVTNDEAVAALTQTTIDAYGQIDVLVSNAGGPEGTGRLWQIPPAEWRQCMEVNLTSHFLCCHAVLPHMIERARGRIINVASAAAFMTELPGLIGYCTAKAGLVHMSAVLANSLKPHGVNVNSVSVSAETQLVREHKARRVALGDPAEPNRPPGADPVENVDLFVWLASDASDHVTGQYIEANAYRSSLRPAAR